MATIRAKESWLAKNTCLNLRRRAGSYYFNPYLLVLLLSRIMARGRGLLLVTRTQYIATLGKGQTQTRLNRSIVAFSALLSQHLTQGPQRDRRVLGMDDCMAIRAQQGNIVQGGLGGT